MLSTRHADMNGMRPKMHSQHQACIVDFTRGACCGRFSVPEATDSPTAPADTSAGAPAAPHPMAAGQQSVQSTGSPGIPKPGGTAPANAAATDTGGGSSVPSSTVHNLDPSAVK